MPPVATVRIGGRERLAPLIAAALTTFLALGLLKPWTGTPGATEQPAFGPGEAKPTPTADLGNLPDHCLDPLGWRVYDRERWPGHVVRTWRALVPATSAADGPLEAGLPVIPILSRVEALGYCSPWAGPERPPDASRLTVWRIVESDAGRSATPITLHLVAPTPSSVLGVLLAPPDGVSLAAESTPSVASSEGPDLEMPRWPDGSFVFALRAPEWERWWGVELATPVLTPAATTMPSAGSRQTSAPATASPASPSTP